MNSNPPRIAIIGCGAVTERGHLPAAARLPDNPIAVLVDTNRARAEALARQYLVPNVIEDYTQIPGKADAAPRKSAARETRSSRKARMVQSRAAER